MMEVSTEIGEAEFLDLEETKDLGVKSMERTTTQLCIAIIGRIYLFNHHHLTCMADQVHHHSLKIKGVLQNLLH